MVDVPLQSECMSTRKGRGKPWYATVATSSQQSFVQKGFLTILSSLGSTACCTMLAITTKFRVQQQGQRGQQGQRESPWGLCRQEQGYEPEQEQVEG